MFKKILKSFLLGNEVKRIMGIVCRPAKKLYFLSRRILGFWSLPCFSSLGRGSEIASPNRIFNPHCIEIGDNVDIGPGSFINAIIESKHIDNIAHHCPRIIIGNRVSATAQLQIHCSVSVVIESDVLFATNVFIADCAHAYKHPDIPYKEQGLFNSNPIRIGRGSWIGQNVVILPGVDIGEFCIIGANSVVRSNIPNRSIAVGSPAHIISTWSSESNCWKRLNLNY